MIVAGTYHGDIITWETRQIFRQVEERLTSRERDGFIDTQEEEWKSGGLPGADIEMKAAADSK